MYHPPATESDYHECLDWVEDSIEGVAACPFLRIAPEGRWLPPGAIDLSDTPGSAWSENSGGGKRLGLLRECEEYAARPEFERDLMSQLLGTARRRLHNGGLSFLRELLHNHPKCFGLTSRPSLAAFKATNRVEEATRFMQANIVMLPYKMSESDCQNTREDPLVDMQLPPRTSHHLLMVFRVKHGRDKWICAEWMFLLPFPPGSPGAPAPTQGSPYYRMPASQHPFAVMLNEDEGRMRMLEGKCSHCGRADGKRYTCTSCGHHSYCGKECQVARWKQHKKLCRLSKAANRSGKMPFGEFAELPAC